MTRRACVRLAGGVAAVMFVLAAQAAEGLAPCRVEGVSTEVLCGKVQRPLDPAQPQGRQIEVHYMVVPAMARNKQPDSVLLLAGGPGQSAIRVAPLVLPRLARLNNRRDLIFIDQRGTGRSAPLECPDESRLSLAESLDVGAQARRIDACRQALEKLPHGDLRQYTTEIAMQDFDAVRAHLGVQRWNLVGASYGTRAALEYQRRYPQHVRSAVLDGVAPPDMVLPAAFSTDGQAALDAMFAGCEGQPACRQRFPSLREEWAALLASLPREVTIHHALTGQPQSVKLGRSTLLRGVRVPLYQPALAAALPAAIHEAAQGRFQPLAGLMGATSGRRKATHLAAGMHFSVVCAEDVPRLPGVDSPGRDFGRVDAEFYQDACKTWPRGTVSPDFYTIPPATAPTLVLSGGADPATPPRHGDRVVKLLGPRAVHVVVPEAGHGVLSLPCMREVLFRFIDTAEDPQARASLDASCATRIPRASVYLPIDGVSQ